MKPYGRTLLILLAFTIGIASLPYLTFEPHGILNNKGHLLEVPVYLAGFYIHVIFGILALVSGPFQFHKSWRTKYPRTHRTLLKLYMLSCLIAGLTGFYIAFYAEGGLASTLGFTFLAAFWLFATLRGYYEMKTGTLELHREWMLRSYALTFAAVTLRIYLPILLVAGLEFLNAYRIISWISWVPNLILMEWVIRYRLVHSGEVKPESEAEG